jgi:predicted transcriptional regulator
MNIDSQFDMRFPEETDIKRMRKTLDITQARLAALSGVSQSTIAKVERGDIKGSYEAVTRLFEVLDDELNRRTQVRKARDVSNSHVVSIQADEKVKNASDIMRNSGYSQLPVFRGVQHVGSLSEKDIMKRIRDGQGMAELGEMRVGDIMNDTFPILSDEAPIEVVTSLLNSSNAVLVSHKGDIVGIITNADILKLIGAPVYSEDG